MKYSVQLIGCFIFIAASFCGKAADTLFVHFSKTQYVPGDTLSFDCAVVSGKGKKKTGTLNLWIEDVHHRELWKLRYPVLNGLSSGDIILPDSLTADVYAFYFSLQDVFFQMRGKVKSGYRDKSIRNVVMLNDKQLVSQELPLDKDMGFRIGKLLFEKQAIFFFSPLKQKKTNRLDVQIETTLDSGFVTTGDTTCLLNIGGVMAAHTAEEYRMNSNIFSGDTTSTLQNVIVTGRRKTAADKFEEEYVSGFFAAMMAWFSMDWKVPNWLVPPVFCSGCQQGCRDFLLCHLTRGTVAVRWRGAETALYLDELPADNVMLESISPVDVAMIKVFRPPFFGSFAGGAGGAIAVYTKRGIDGSFVSGPRHRFVVNGYTPSVYVLPVSAKRP